MPLDLPARFNNDIQSKDTALIPVVVIGGTFPQSPFSTTDIISWLEDSIQISTNAFSFNMINNEYNTLPILLNIPSLKESIDIEKRNYKISSVNLDISNFPYGGKRFSELVGDASLINTEVSIFWWSPSTNYLLPWASNNEAFMCYFGTIRRYTHDDEKVRLVVEDRSQATLHTDLPTTILDPENDSVPDKSKNKPVPMVYGHVDRSPIVPHYSDTEEISTNGVEVINYLEYRLKADTEEVDFESNEETITIGGASHTISPLYFYENDAYHNVHKTSADLSPAGSGTGEINFRYGLTDIVLDVDLQDLGTGENIILNDFQKGHLRVHAVRRFNRIEKKSLGSVGAAGSDLLHIDTVAGGFPGRIYGQINMKVTGISGGSSHDWTAASLKCYLEPISVPNDLAVDDDGNIEKPVTRLLKHITHYQFRESSDDEYTGLSPDAGTDDIPSSFNAFQGVPNAPASTHWGAFNVNDHGVNWNINGDLSQDSVVNVYFKDLII